MNVCEIGGTVFFVSLTSTEMGMHLSQGVMGKWYK